MKFQDCITPEPHGDCWRACIATITGAAIEAVPNFMHIDAGPVVAGGKRLADEGLRLTREWLAPQGLSLFETYCSAGWSLNELLDTFSKPNPGVPIIVCGFPKADPSEGHAVIAMDGKIVHDPSGQGLGGPYTCQIPGCDCGMTWWWLYSVSVTDRWTDLKTKE